MVEGVQRGPGPGRDLFYRGSGHSCADVPVYVCESSCHSCPALHRRTGPLAPPVTTTPWPKAIGFSQTTVC